MQAMNMYTLPTNKYPAGIVNWPQQETDATETIHKSKLDLMGVGALGAMTLKL